MQRIFEFSMHSFVRNSKFLGDYAIFVRVAICKYVIQVDFHELGDEFSQDVIPNVKAA